jgi:hypothetical protein
MDAAASTRRAPRRVFTLAAWFSLLAPLAAAGWYVVAVSNRRAVLLADDGVGVGDLRRHETAALAVAAAVFGAGLVAGCASLWGVRVNGPWAILPPAALGILVSGGLGLLALLGLVLSGLPGP